MDKPTFDELEKENRELRKKIAAMQGKRPEEDYLVSTPIELIPINYQILDTDGKLLFVNDFWLETLGYSEKEIEGVSFSDFIIPNDREKFSNAFNILKNDFASFKKTELTLTGKDGSYIHILLNGKRSNKTGHFHFAFKDITEIVQVKDILEEKQEQLNIAQHVGQIGSWQLDPEKGIVTASEEAFSIYGLPYNEKGISLDEIQKYVVPDDRKTVDQAIKDLLEKNSIYNQVFSIVRDSNGNKEYRIVRSRARLFNLKSSPGVKVIGSIQDITETKRVEEELIRAKERAEESDRLKTAFLANMSHEIRTPMNAILGFSELINIGDITPEQRREYTRIINTKGKQLLTLIDDIIEVAKFESGHLNISKSEVNLNRLMEEIESAAREKRSQLKKESIEIRPDIPYNLGIGNIYTDSGRLQQVMLNLIDNALKFTEHGYVQFGYSMKDNKAIQFYVKDTGIGLSKENQRIIFNRFRQIELTASRLYAGSGLGLTISKGIVELLGGRIWIESEQGKGTTFYFTIPYQKPQAKKSEAEPQETNLTEYNWKNKVILVAEDEEVNFRFLEAVLSRTEVQLINAVNGRQAIDLVKNINKIDLILMDIKMPEMNGYDATREIKKIRPDIPVIAQTAFSMQNDREKSLEAGCDDYIPKPIDIHNLMSKISHFLTERQQSRDLNYDGSSLN